MVPLSNDREACAAAKAAPRRCLRPVAWGVLFLAVASATAAKEPPAGLRLSAPGEGLAAKITVVGAVGRQGVIAVSPLAATVDGVIGRAGGAQATAYRFAALTLRAAAGAEESPTACLSLVDLHAALLLEGDRLLSATDLSQRLRAGQLRRVPAPDIVRGMGEVSAPPLYDGDVLAVPERTDVVYVVPQPGRTMTFQHEPTVRADDYLERADPDGEADVDRYVLLYPDGRTVGLDLKPWRYEPTMVPPGSLIAPAIDCLGGE